MCCLPYSILSIGFCLFLTIGVIRRDTYNVEGLAKFPIATLIILVSLAGMFLGNKRHPHNYFMIGLSGTIFLAFFYIIIPIIVLTIRPISEE